ncbi:alpha/beta fold hydrolase [Neobacillus sp. NPDC093182]|uniref:alpha/beta fold hydrolase n=1 Tax=Neobacillus sp. NPDC093182 TaxID=3364297 RepID=UPI0037FBC1FC
MPKVKTNGIELYYEERGSGTPLFLIMGLGADGSLWEEHVKVYEEHFRCILIDNRGSGRSEKPEGPYSTKEMAEDIAGLMKALQIEKAHVSGISMGSGIAQELALTYPQMIKSLTLIASWDQCEPYTKRIFEMFRSTAGKCEPSTFTRVLQLWIFTPDYHKYHLDDLLRREQEGDQNPYPMPLHSFQAQCDACISHNTKGRLGSINVPVLVTSGDIDIFTPLSYSKAIADEIPNAELFVLPGTGHTHHWEKLREFNEKTLEFMLLCDR